jgi:hypothetical protein
MYNANRFAERAKKAEAQGRTFEAQGYWAQAEVRADSVVARHPNSTWADNAQLIRGEAMVHRNDCAAAIPALEAASPRATADVGAASPSSSAAATSRRQPRQAPTRRSSR